MKKRILVFVIVLSYCFASLLTLVSCKSSYLNSKKSPILLDITKEADSNAFVNLRNYSNDFVFDMKYATADNFLKEKVYPCDECFLRVKTVKALLEANKSFLKKGYKIKLYDCYRPKAIQKKMFQLVPDPNFVANPKKGSIHNRGGAVDISLVDSLGVEVNMGTKFDFFDKNGNWFETALIGLNVNFPLFNGGARIAKINKAKLELQQVDNQMVALKNNIDNELSQAKLNYMSSVATVNFQKKNMQLAEDVYGQTKKKFEAGAGSNTEISAAQADLVTAQNNFMNALYSALIAKVDLLKASGKL